MASYRVTLILLPCYYSNGCCCCYCCCDCRVHSLYVFFLLPQFMRKRSIFQNKQFDVALLLEHKWLSPQKCIVLCDYWLLIFCCDFFFFPAVVAADAPSNHFILALMSGKQIDLNPSICVNARSNECYVTDAYWTKIKMDSWATVKMGTANVRGIENSEIKMAKKAICCCSLCSQYL